jgi:hypothetical protein
LEVAAKLDHYTSRLYIVHYAAKDIFRNSYSNW